jgi:SPP1 gp7 family putative phage head morphogenesis protein
LSRRRTTTGQRAFDAIIRHRINVQRFMRGEVADVLDLIGTKDAQLVEELRRRLPHVAVGDIRGLRLRKLMQATFARRVEAFAEAKAEVREQLVAFGRVEAQAVNRMMGAAVSDAVAFNPVRAAQIREAVTRTPFSGGKDAARTLGQWFGDMAKADQRRLLGAIQLGIHNQETVDTIVRRIAGTRANGYKDGVLAVTRREAETVVRTAINHTANEAQRAWGEENADVVAGFQWSSMLDERTCGICKRRDGKFVAVGRNQPPEGMEVADGSPPAHFQCRCTLVTVFKLDDLADKIDDADEDSEERAA